MKAIVQSGYGEPHEVLEFTSAEEPRPGPGMVLVRMEASSVNTPDWLFTYGVPKVLRIQTGLRGPHQPIRGTDVAGVVEEVGPDVTDLEPGTPVLGSTWTNKAARTDGAFAEFALAPANQLVRRPSDELDVEDAAALVMSGATALRAMQQGEVGKGTRVLVNGASGGVGSFAVQMAAQRGATVTGVCSGGNADLVTSLGADDVIDYVREDFTTSGRQWDVILDNVMNHPPQRTIGALAPGGILMPNAVGDGNPWLLSLPRMGLAALLGVVRRGDVRFVDTRTNQATFAELVRLVVTGSITPVIDSTYDLAHAADAIAHMAGHHARGNIVIRM